MIIFYIQILLLFEVQIICLLILKTLFKKEEGCPEHEILYEYLFSKFNLLEKIKSNFPKNSENEGNTGVGYTSFLVSLCYKINTVIGGVPLNLGKSYTKEGIITDNYYFISYFYCIIIFLNK